MLTFRQGALSNLYHLWCFRCAKAKQCRIAVSSM